MSDNLEDVKVGDKLIMKHDRWPDEIAEVGRVTAKQFETVKYKYKFWKKNGYHVGGSSQSWTSMRCVHADEAAIQEICDAQKHLRKADKIHNLITSANLKVMSEDSLDRILAVLEKERAIEGWDVS